MSLERKHVIDWLRQNVSAHRLDHILGVEQMCESLALQHGFEPSAAAQAGLLHDLAKFFPPPKLLRLAQANDIPIDSICAKMPHLLHADVSAVVAKETFGVQDDIILQAIANHTLGQPMMDTLSCIVFVADALEPGRGESKTLQKLRSVSTENLMLAVAGVCDYTFKYLIKHQKTIHPRMVDTRNWALAEAH